jgi:hypothetical protein
MAYCAPRQLIDLLPQVVPVLVSAFLDPHPKVQAAGRAALGDVGQVIRNPELATIVPALLAAIADPAKATEPAILAIARTDFVHALDAPSLAIMVPILRRGLSERSTGLRMSATTVVSCLGACAPASPIGNGSRSSKGSLRASASSCRAIAEPSDEYWERLTSSSSLRTSTPTENPCSTGITRTKQVRRIVCKVLCNRW